MVECKTIKDKVASILNLSEKARNCDKYLMLLYWRHYDNVDFKQPTFIEDFQSRCTTPTSIVRARALLQAEGQFPATEETRARRSSREQGMRASIGGFGEVYEDEDCGFFEC